MSKALDDLQVSQGAAIYYTTEFRDTIEDHLSFLKNHDRTTIMMVENIDAVRYQFDLGGLLLSYGVPVYLHWIIARMNDYTAVQGYPIKLDPVTGTYRLLVPDSTAIDSIVQLHNTRNTIA